MNATRAQLTAQYKRAKSLLWIEHFREAANTYTPDLFDTADLMAIGSRETNLDPKWLTKKGDNGHGAGLMQIDDRSFPDFTNSTKWKDARLGILYGAKVLRQKWDDLQNTAGKSLKFKGNSFTGPRVAGIVAQQIAIAAYNSGRAAAYHYSKGRTPDYGTTGKDYSADVMQRAKVFRELLAKDGMLDKSVADDPPAVVMAGAGGAGAAIFDPPAEQPPVTNENVFVEGENPELKEGWLKRKWKEALAGLGGITGITTLKQNADGLGLPAEIMTYAVIAAVGGFVLWLVGSWLNEKVIRPLRARMLTTSLVNANATPTNTVRIASPELLSQLESEGYTVIRRS